MSRPLRLHSSALSDAEYDYFTATLALLTDYRLPEGSAREDKDFAAAAELDASGLCAWLLGKLCPAFPHDRVATIMSSVAPSGGIVDGTQFFAVARLALHCLNGETIEDGDDCRRLAFVQVQNVPLHASRDAERAPMQSSPAKLRVHFWPPDEDKPCQFEFAFPVSGLFHPESQSRTFQATYGPDISLGVYSYFDATANCWTTTPEPLRISPEQPTVHIRGLPRRDAPANSRKRPRTSDLTAESASAPPAAQRAPPVVKQPKYPATPAPSPGHSAPDTPVPTHPQASCNASTFVSLPPISSISTAASFSIPLSSSPTSTSTQPAPPVLVPVTMPPGHPLPELATWPRTPRSAFPFKYACHMAAFFEAVEGLKPVFPNKEEAYRYLMQGTAPWHASTYWKHHRLYAKRERDARLRTAVDAGMCEAGEWNRYLREEEAAGRVQDAEMPATPVA
ncbi:hypothetical protein GGG16DRAFT_93224 [Schizophyllum commune]